MSSSDDLLPAPTRQARSRRLRYALPFAGIWLIALVGPAQDVVDRSSTAAATALGLLLVAAFVVLYLVAVVEGWEARGTPRALLLVGALALLTLALLPFAGTSALIAFVFVGVVCQIVLPWRQAVVAALLLAAAAVLLTVLSPEGGDPSGIGFSVLAGSMAMFGVVRMTERNRALLVAESERAELAVLQERERFSRDLHDILGHSLTVITVKSELAGKLVEQDRDRARAEIQDVERLARQALADIRATVGNYREVSLAAEIASARSALVAAGIEPDLPGAVDDVPVELAETFGYVVREGVTNVVRHSDAHRCRVRVGRTSVEVVDDGRGCEPRPPGAAASGHGLEGLRHRADAVGLVLEAGPLPGAGYRLAACLPGSA